MILIGQEGVSWLESSGSSWTRSIIDSLTQFVTRGTMLEWILEYLIRRAPNGIINNILKYLQRSWRYFRCVYSFALMDFLDRSNALMYCILWDFSTQGRETVLNSWYFSDVRFLTDLKTFLPFVSVLIIISHPCPLPSKHDIKSAYFHSRHLPL